MSKRKRKNLLKIVKQRQQSDFTGREDEIALFKENLNLDYEDERRRFIFNIWGQGGVGKTTLLRRFRKMAQESDMVTAMVDEGESDIPAVMGQMSKQLSEQGYELKKFNERYKTYRQKREELESDVDAPTGGIGYAAGVVTRTALTVGKLHPIGSAFTTLMNEDKLVDQVSQWADHARRKLGNKDDVRLVLEPVDVLTPIFLADLDKIADDHGVVLLFDTYEQTSSFLDTWLRDILEGRHGDVLPLDFLVIAGRDELVLNKWSAYEKLIARIPLEPFTEEEAITFLKSKGIENGEVIQFILEISGRFPLLVATLATEAPQRVDEVAEPSSTAVERFLWWIDDPLLRQVAVDAALPRRINRDIVAVIAGEEQADGLFEWLKGRPFVIERTDGWSYHDVVRPLMLRHKRRESPTQWASLHGKLSDYFLSERARLALSSADGVKNDEWMRYAEALIYHRLCQAPEKVHSEIGFLVTVLHNKREFAQRLAEIFITAGNDCQHQMVSNWGEKIRAGLQAYKDKDYKAASELFTKLLAVDNLQEPEKVILLDWRSYCWKELGDLDKAMTDLDQALSFDPDYKFAVARRGLVYRLREEYEKAVADFSRAIEIDPVYESAITSRGVAYLHYKKYEKALADFDRAIELDPQDEWGFARRGEAYRLSDNHEKALENFNQAIEMNAKIAWVFAHRGETYRLQEEYEKALADFDRAIEIDPDYGWAIASRGRVYHTQEEYGKALADFDRFVEIKPDYGWVFAQRGETYRLLEEYEKALADFNRAIELDPDYKWAIASRGQVYQEQKEYEKALVDFNRAIEIDPDYKWVIVSRGQVYRDQEEYEKALADFKRAIEIDSKDAWAITHRGYVYRLQGEYEKALADFNRAIELDPAYTWAITRRGELYKIQKEYGKALSDFNQAIEIDPEYRWAIMEKGDLCLSIGRYEEALENFDQATAIKSSDFAYYLSAIAYKLIGTEDKFEKYLKLAIGEAREQLAAKPTFYRVAFNLALYLYVQSNEKESLDVYRQTLANGARQENINDAITDLLNLRRWLPDLYDNVDPIVEELKAYRPV